MNINEKKTHPRPECGCTTPPPAFLAILPVVLVGVALSVGHGGCCGHGHVVVCSGGHCLGRRLGRLHRTWKMVRRRNGKIVAMLPLGKTYLLPDLCQKGPFDHHSDRLTCQNFTPVSVCSKC